MTFRYLGPPVMGLASLPEEPELEQKANVSNVVQQLVALVEDVLTTAEGRPLAPPHERTLPTAVDIPMLTKAVEDGLLRPPGEGEVVCLSGVHCECMQMARFPPHNDAAAGFHGVAARHGYCLLCLRVMVSKSFYISAMTGTNAPQLLRNRICQPGEYSKDVCFLPCASNSFLTDPVVMHQRNVSLQRTLSTGLRLHTHTHTLTPVTHPPCRITATSTVASCSSHA